MSFIRTDVTTSHRPSFTIPEKARSQHLNMLTEELELIDMAQQTAEGSSNTKTRVHIPQPPSPLITFAPNSPPLSPVDLTSPTASFQHDLYFTAKAVPAFSDPPSAPPTVSMPPSRQADSTSGEPILRKTRFIDLEAAHRAAGEDGDLEACMPAGWPYRHWRDYAWLAWEWICNMQSLLMNLMEQEHRLGGARHTI
ncbi:MAG: hypothetical protein LQ337_000777 [Flavoplaca oasis]|nr:MAG: hypothetical protein LQ337_000777 [Flavoplaca oasis]